MPSFTGMGDKAHLLGPTITIDTFVQDLVEVIVRAELADIVLVGHSFGGIPISGVADRLPGRIAQLVYLDAVVVESGRNAFSYYPRSEVDARLESAKRTTNSVAVPPPDPLPSVWGLGKPGDADYEFVRQQLSPHPLRTYLTPLALRAPVGNGLPRTYVTFSEPSHPLLEASRQLVRSWPGWKWAELAVPHDSIITHPDEVSRLLLTISGQGTLE
jgi:pimeloyl-ACP methyl ester carboxylesterase